MADRIAGLIAAIVAVAFFIAALDLEVPFFSEAGDPLGPKFFPMAISAVAFVSAGVLLFKPDADPTWPRLSVFIKLCTALAVLLLFAYGLKPLGFLLASALASAAISYLINPQVKRSVLTGVVLSVVLLLIFKYALGLSLHAFPRWLTG